MKSRVAAPAVAIVLALLAAGCGGGNSDPAPTAPPPPPAPPAPTGAPVVSNSCDAFTAVATDSGLPVNGTLAAKATSPAGRALTYSLVTQPQSGTVELDAAGAYRFTPAVAAGLGKLSSFTYQVTDSAGLKTEGTAQVLYGRTRIMPLGDSITDGVETYTDGLGEGPVQSMKAGYRLRLYDRLTQGGYAVNFVGGAVPGGGATGLADTNHEGHSGYTQQQIVDGIEDSNWLVNSPADVVLLHIGTNDINNHADANSTSVADTDKILQAIDTWSSNAANPPVQLLLAKLIKQRPDAAHPSDVLIFNSNLTNLYNTSWATAKPKITVDLVDMYSILNTSTELSPADKDQTGLHPNTTGYGKMGDAWFDYLVQNKAVAKCQ